MTTTDTGIRAIRNRTAKAKEQRAPKRRARGPGAGHKTRATIVEVAERLFADSGVDAVSLRTITDAAGVSLCLVNYHFGTKEGLLRAIFEKSAIPLNQTRVAMLDDAERDGRVATVDELLRAFFLPGLRAGLAKAGKPGAFDRLLGRVGSDPSPYARRMMHDYFDPFQVRFMAALKRTLPDADETDLYWRLHCMLGVVMYSATNPIRIYELSSGRCDFRDIEKAFDSLRPGLKAMLLSASPAPESGA